MTATEYVVLVDEQDHEIGQAEKLSAHQNNQLHRAFSIFIFRQRESLEVLLQQRALDKYHSAGLWTNACCSHPRPGEGIVSAGERRLKEELGISCELEDRAWFCYNAHFPNGLSEHELDHVLVGYFDDQQVIKPNPAEVHAYRWIGIETLREELAAKPAQFTPWFAQALEIAAI